MGDDSLTITRRARVGRDLLKPSLRERYGITQSGTVNINPGDWFGNSPVNINEDLDRVSEQITSLLVQNNELGSELTQTSATDAQVEQITRDILGDGVAVQDLLSPNLSLIHI